MQYIKLSFKIFDKKIILKAFEDYRKVVNCKIEMDSEDSSIITFHTDDSFVTKEFSNYLIALSAGEV